MSKVFNEDLTINKLSDHLDQLYNFVKSRNTTNNINLIKEIIMNSDEIPINCIYKIVYIIYNHTNIRCLEYDNNETNQENIKEIGECILDYIAENIELDLEIFLKKRSISESIILHKSTNPLFENNNQQTIINVRFSINEIFITKCYEKYKNFEYHSEKKFRYFELSIKSNYLKFQDIIIKLMRDYEINNYIEYISDDLLINIPEHENKNIISRLISDETYFKNKKGYMSTIFRKIIKYFPNISFNNCEYLIHCYNIVGWNLTTLYIDRVNYYDLCDSLYKILQKTANVSCRKFDIIERIIREIIIRKDKNEDQLTINSINEKLFNDMVYNSNILNKLCRNKHISDNKMSIIEIFMKYNLINLDFQEKTRAKHKTLRAIMENNCELDIFTDFDDNGNSTFMKNERTRNITLSIKKIKKSKINLPSL